MKRKETVTVSDAVARIKELIGCPSSVIANFIGVSPNSLSNNMETELDNWNSKKSGYKLDSVLRIIERLAVLYPYLPNQGYVHAFGRLTFSEAEPDKVYSASDLIKSGEFNLDNVLIVAKMGADDFTNKRIKKEPRVR